MSRKDFQQSTYAFAKFMQHAADEIAAGRAKGARIVFKHADKKRTHIGWLRRQILRGEFRQRG